MISSGRDGPNDTAGISGLNGQRGQDAAEARRAAAQRSGEDEQLPEPALLSLERHLVSPEQKAAIRSGDEGLMETERVRPMPRAQENCFNCYRGGSMAGAGFCAVARARL